MRVKSAVLRFERPAKQLGQAWLLVAGLVLYALLVVTFSEVVLKEVVIGPVTGAFFSTVVLVPLIFVALYTITVVAKALDRPFNPWRWLIPLVGAGATLNFAIELFRFSFLL